MDTEATIKHTINAISFITLFWYPAESNKKPVTNSESDDTTFVISNVLFGFLLWFVLFLRTACSTLLLVISVLAPSSRSASSIKFASFIISSAYFSICFFKVVNISRRGSY